MAAEGRNRRLPPLKALRAFEAAGRLGSYKAAAEELSVTPGAIKRQIKTLEDHFQVSLTERNQANVVLTAESRSYLSLITEVFHELETSSRQLAGPPDEHLLHILAPLTFASRWLVPRLPQFRRQFSDLDVRLVLSRLRNIPGSSGDVDVSLQLVTEPIPGFRIEPFMRSVLVAVCSPRLIAPGSQLTARELASRYTQLCSTSTADAWSRWLQSDALPHTGRRMDLATDALAYQAAELGLGVAIADRELVTEQLESGSLVSPVDRSLDTEQDWACVYREDVADDPRVARFRGWLKRQKR